MFVKVSNSYAANKKFGKIVDNDTDTGIVEFFDNPIDNPEEIRVPISKLKLFELPVGTRVYVYDVNRDFWYVGSVSRSIKEGNNIINYEVNFPSGSIPKDMSTRFFKIDDLNLRVGIPIDDPSKFLASRITENLSFFEKRSNYQKCVLEQKILTKGVEALLSSIIEIEKHQIEVVSRVLRDPIQRYLLADEVGLGKTIEAGIILKQFIIDEPNDHQVLIIVPPELVSQWDYELRARFLLGSNLDSGKIEIIALNEFEEIDEFLQNTTVNMIIIDEAHRLTKNNYPELYTTILENGRDLDRFLMLSGTPVLNNENGFLEMLNLLDPNVYNSENSDDFHRQVESRQQLAEIISRISVDDIYLIDESLDELEDLFPDDTELASLSQQLREKIDEHGETVEPDLLEKLHALQGYLSESYKLDRRILKNRRKNVKGLTPARTGVKKVQYSSENSYLLDQIELLRLNLFKFVTNLDDVYKDLIANFFFSTVREVIEGGLTSNKSSLFLKDFEATLLSLKNDENINFDNLLEDLNKVLLGIENQDYNSKFEAIKEIVLENKSKIILIFCSSNLMASHLKEYLEGNIDDPPVYYQENPSELRKVLLSTNPSILICDKSSEEGLNLQGPNRLVVHFDLPLDPNRLEQRIGRVDRFGGLDFNSIILEDISNSYEIEWNKLMVEKLEIFEQSIAGLQFLLESETTKLVKNIFKDAAGAIEDLGEKLAGPKGLVMKEQKRVLQQENLDSFAEPLYEEYSDNLRDRYELVVGSLFSKGIDAKQTNGNLIINDDDFDEGIKFLKQTNNDRLFTSIFRQSEFIDNKYRDLQIQMLDSDVENIRKPIMAWVVDTLGMKTDIHGFKVFVQKKYANLDWLENKSSNQGKMILSHLSDFHKTKPLLKWGIIKDRKSLDLMSDYLSKKGIAARLVEFQRPYEVWKALDTGEIDFVVVSPEYLRKNPKRKYHLLLDPNPKADEGVFRFFHMPTSKVPVNVFSEKLVDALDPSFGLGKGHDYPSFRYTFDRKIALKNLNAENNVRLVRSGDPYFNGLNSITDLDDRGKSFAIIRFDKDWREGKRVFICYEFQINVDVKSATNNLYTRQGIDREKSKPAIERYANIFFQPEIIKVWVDSEIERVKDTSILKILERPYSHKPRDVKHGTSGTSYDLDFNFNFWQEAKKLKLPRLESWEEFVSSGKIAAENMIFSSKSVKSKIENSLNSFKVDIKKQIVQLRTRSKRITESQNEMLILQCKRDLEYQEIIAESLANGILKPHLSCLGVGAIFLAKDLTSLQEN